MPITNGIYENPGWVDGEAPAINAEELNALSGAVNEMETLEKVWQAGTLPDSRNWTSVAYGNGLFVAVASGPTNLMSVSEDGLTWTDMAMGASANWTSVAYGNGVFVAVAKNYGYAMVYDPAAPSIDLVQITQTLAWSCVAYGEGFWIIFAEGSGTIATTTDPWKWTITTNTGLDANAHLAAAYKPTTTNSACWVVVIGSSSEVYYSYTGTSGWTSATISPSMREWDSVCYGDAGFVAVASAGACAVSPDGRNWAQGSLPRSVLYGTVTFFDGKYVALPANAATGYAAVSTDGLHWTEQALPYSSQYTGSACGNGKLVGVANLFQYNLLLSSPLADRVGEELLKTDGIGLRQDLLAFRAVIPSTQWYEDDGAWAAEYYNANISNTSYPFGQTVQVTPGNGVTNSRISTYGVTWTIGTRYVNFSATSQPTQTLTFYVYITNYRQMT